MIPLHYSHIPSHLFTGCLLLPSGTGFCASPPSAPLILSAGSNAFSSGWIAHPSRPSFRPWALKYASLLATSSTFFLLFSAVTALICAMCSLYTSQNFDIQENGFDKKVFPGGTRSIKGVVRRKSVMKVKSARENRVPYDDPIFSAIALMP